MLPSTSWSCLNKCTSLLRYIKKKKNAIKGRAPWNIQNYRNSLPFPNVIFLILTSTELHYHFCNKVSPTMHFSPVINHTQATSCLKKVLPSITVCFSLNTQASSYFLLFSELSFWDVSSHNSSETVFQSSTNDLLINHWEPFSVPILLDFLKCQKAMTNSSWKLSRSLALKTVLSWSSFRYSNYFFCLSWSIFHFLLQKHGILLGLFS